MISIDMNYETHGNYRLIDCIYMSCCFPIFMKPCFINDNLYLDGGILNNCPYYSCLDKYECRISELLILTNINSDASFKNNFREKTNRFIKYNNSYSFSLKKVHEREFLISKEFLLRIDTSKLNVSIPIFFLKEM